MSTQSSPSGARALDDAVLSTSLWVSVVTVFINIGAAIVLVRRAFPASFGRFISMDSAISVMSARCRLLFYANMLLGIESISNTVHFYSLRHYKTSNVLANRLIYLATFPPSGPLQAVAAVQRCAMIVSQRPEVRLRLIRVSQIVAVVILAVLEIASIWATVELYNMGPRADLVTWVTTLYIPNSIAVAVALLPLMIVVASMWALVSTLTTTTRQRLGRMASAVSSAVTLPKVGGRPPNPTITKSTTAASLSALAASSTTATVKSSVRRSGTYRLASAQLRYPLSSTFVILSITLSMLWCLTLVFFAIGSIVGTARTYTVVTLISSLGICTEAGFEKILQLASRQQAKKRLPRDMDMTMFDAGASRSAAAPGPLVPAASAAAISAVNSPPSLAISEETSQQEAEGI